MIIPQKEKSKRPQYISAGVTIAVIVITYLVLILTEMYEVRSHREMYRELDFVKIIEFLPERKPEMRQPETMEEARAEEVVETESVTRTPQRVDLKEIIGDRLHVDLDAPQRTVTERRTADASDAGSRRPLRMDQTELGDVGGFETLKDMAFPLPRRPDGDAGAGGLDIGGLQVGDGTGTGGIAGEFGANGSVLGGPQARQADDGTAHQIGLKGLDEFGDDYSDLHPIYKALAEWMRNNPADLPVAVRRLMADRWDDSYLSSRVQFEADGRSFDMLLMCKEEIYEVHIMLVERLDHTYLIDRNFQRESNSLRVGGVVRGDDDIATVHSEMRPAGADRSQEFYQIFLSWWETISSEIE